jgi:hypothetical protein
MQVRDSVILLDLDRRHLLQKFQRLFIRADRERDAMHDEPAQSLFSL